MLKNKVLYIVCKCQDAEFILFKILFCNFKDIVIIPFCCLFYNILKLTKLINLRLAVIEKYSVKGTVNKGLSVIVGSRLRKIKAIGKEAVIDILSDIVKYRICQLFRLTLKAALVNSLLPFLSSNLSASSLPFL